MTTIDPCMLNHPSPPDAQILSSPTEAIITSFPSFEMGKTPRPNARIHIGDNEYFPSPRRVAGGVSGLHYGSISQAFDVAENAGTTPKTMLGAVETPTARYVYSSPAQTTTGRSVLHGVFVPGDEWDSLSIPQSPFPESTFHMSPMATASTKRSLAGLGSSPSMRTGKRQRQATMGNISVPPSPLGNRPREAPTGVSLMTIRPLERTVSGPPAMGMPFPTNQRVFSSASMTSSASNELMSPALGSFPMNLGINETFGAPDMMHLNFSEQRKSGTSLLPTGTIAPQAIMGNYQMPSGFVTSPEIMKPDQFAQIGISSQGMTIGGRPCAAASLLPTSVPMMHGSSYASHDGRHNTLGTIQENEVITPATTQAASFTSSLSYSMGMPSQPFLSAQSTFQAMSYPPVPGMSFDSSPDEGLKVAVTAWTQNTHSATQMRPDEFTSDPAQPPHQGPPQPLTQRATSFNYHMSLDNGPIFQAVQRSVSAPYINTLPPMTGNAPSVSQGGLFGPGSSSFHTINSPLREDCTWDPVPPTLPYAMSGPRSSPNTPSKKRTVYPPVGKRLRPGPKPKPKTPGKGKGKSDDKDVQSTVNPAIFMGGAPLFSSGDEDETYPPPSSNPTTPGPSSFAIPSSSTTAMHYPIPVHADPQISFGPEVSSLEPHSSSQTDSNPTQPLPPPARSQTPEGQTVTGLPKEFIDKLYTTFLMMDGTTGQPVKRFKCMLEGCERHFPRKSAISSHIQTHLDDKPFVCTEPDCQAAFVRQHDLRRHMRIHSGNKPFPCACGKGFARGDALMRHRQRNICNGGIPRRGEM